MRVKELEQSKRNMKTKKPRRRSRRDGYRGCRKAYIYNICIYIYKYIYIYMIKKKLKNLVVGPEETDIGDVEKHHGQPLQPQAERPSVLRLGFRV